MATDDIPYDASRAIAIFRSVEMDLSGSEKAWRYGGGRDLSRLTELRERSSEAFEPLAVDGVVLIPAEAFEVDRGTVLEDGGDIGARDEFPGRPELGPGLRP